MHWDGTTWTVTVLDPSVSQNYLYAVWAAAPDDVWAVGGGGAIVHYDGAAWASVVVGNGADADAVQRLGQGAQRRLGRRGARGRSCTGTARRGAAKPTRATA